MLNMKLVNIGCGYIAHPDWINLDIAPATPIVKSFDLRRGLPEASGTIDVCYSSHVLEHLLTPEAQFLVQDCFRVLKPGGILRLVVPDLENIVREYLRCLDMVDFDQENWDYHWMTLELLDQLVRHHQGGEMARYLDQDHLPNEEFIASRMGFELGNCRSARRKSVIEKLKSKRLGWFVRVIRNKIAEFAVLAIAGRQSQLGFREGIFRQSGELHRWMYDRYSLHQLLKQVGFTEIRVCRADESKIPDFNAYELDIYQGNIRKPDSLFMEAIKP
jgi:predicted SAM-dependent methyltransferase